MPKPRATWRAVFMAYQCPTCGAGRGEDCTTKTGKPAGLPHAARIPDQGRCPQCGAIVGDPSEPDKLCPRHALVRSLEIERSTTWVRQDPD